MQLDTSCEFADHIAVSHYGLSCGLDLIKITTNIEKGIYKGRIVRQSPHFEVCIFSFAPIDFNPFLNIEVFSEKVYTTT